jgi:hypothetical protein
MDIPTPTELRDLQNTANGPLVDAAVSNIVAAMKRATTGRIIVDINVDFSIRAMVAQRFVARGWGLKYWDDQRDGSSVELMPL